MTYTRKDLLSDLVLLLILFALGGGIYHVLKPSLAKLATSLFHPRPPVPPLAEGTPVDYGWSVTSLDGHTTPVASFKGKVVFLNFWATWCGPCRMEFPSIQKLHEKF